MVNERFLSNTTNASNLGSNKSNNASEIAITDPNALRISILHSVLITIGAVGTLGNLIVIIAILNYRIARKKLANLFIINQSFIDLTASILLIADYSISKDSFPFLYNNRVSDQIVCKLWVSALPQWSVFMASEYGILLLTFERYLAIVHPLVHSAKFTARKGAICMFATWFIGVGYNMSVLIPTSHILDDGVCYSVNYWPNDACKLTVACTTFLLQYVVPVACLLTCYSQMLYTLRHRLLASNRFGDSTNRSEREIAQKDYGVYHRIANFWKSRCCTEHDKTKDNDHSPPKGKNSSDFHLPADYNTTARTKPAEQALEPREMNQNLCSISDVYNKYQEKDTKHLADEAAIHQEDSIKIIQHCDNLHGQDTRVLNEPHVYTIETITTDDQSISEDTTNCTSSRPTSEIETYDSIHITSSSFSLASRPKSAFSVEDAKTRYVHRRNTNKELNNKSDSIVVTGHRLSHDDNNRNGRRSKQTPFDRARINIFKTLLTVGVCFVSCWTINEVLFFMAAFGYDLDYTGILYLLSVFLVCLHCCINPFIYAIQYPDFQIGVKLIINAIRA